MFQNKIIKLATICYATKFRLENLKGRHHIGDSVNNRVHWWWALRTS
jgi:hypothetical protein